MPSTKPPKKLPLLFDTSTAGWVLLKAEHGLAGIGAMYLLAGKLLAAKGYLPMQAIPMLNQEMTLPEQLIPHAIDRYAILQSDGSRFWAPEVLLLLPKQRGVESPENAKKSLLQFSEREQASYKLFQEWLNQHCPRVQQMQQPISIAEYLKLVKQYPKQQLMDVLKAMQNWKPLLTKNVSAYLTANNWIDKRVNEPHGQQQQPIINQTDQKIQAAIRAAAHQRQSVDE